MHAVRHGDELFIVRLVKIIIHSSKFFNKFTDFRFKKTSTGLSPLDSKIVFFKNP